MSTVGTRSALEERRSTTVSASDTSRREWLRCAIRLSFFRVEAARRAATDAEIAEMKTQLERGLRCGAVAVGFGIQYVPKASSWEILEMFRVAARFGASCHVHLRNAGLKEPASSTQALEEVIAATAITGAPLHVVHVQSTGGKATPRLLQMIAEARARNLDVTTECYPYIAGMTDIKSAIFNEGWQEVFGIDYRDLQWAATGERLTKESFERYRKQGGMVAVFSMTEEIVETALKHPLTMIASDGILQNGKGHREPPVLHTCAGQVRARARSIKFDGCSAQDDAHAGPTTRASSSFDEE